MNKFEIILANGAQRPHGTRARAAHCSCVPCRAAVSRYVCERQAARKAGDNRKLVDAEPVRLHLIKLRGQGMGREQVADVAGVGKTVLGKIAARKQTRIRAHRAAAVLAVRANNQTRADGALVDAAATHRRLADLVERGS